MFPPLVVAREQNRPAYLAAESTRVAKTDDLDHYSQDYHSFVSAAIVLRRIYSYILTFIPCEMPRMACLGAASSISASWLLLSFFSSRGVLQYSKGAGKIPGISSYSGPFLEPLMSLALDEEGPKIGESIALIEGPRTP